METIPFDKYAESINKAKLWFKDAVQILVLIIKAKNNMTDQQIEENLAKANNQFDKGDTLLKLISTQMLVCHQLNQPEEEGKDALQSIQQLIENVVNAKYGQQEDEENDAEIKDDQTMTYILLQMSSSLSKLYA